MLLPSAKIEKACDKKDIRGMCQAPYLDGNTLVATNGHILAAIPVETDGDDSGYISLEALSYARKNKAPCINANGALLVCGAEFPRPDLGKFPEDWKKLIPATENMPDVVINAKLLFDLAQALGAWNKAPLLGLYFKKDETGDIDPAAPIAVKPWNVDSREAKGVIMPCRL